MVWPCLENAHQPSTKTAIEVQAQWQGGPTGGAPLRWCDLINRDLRGITNWTESITDRQHVHGYPAPVPQMLDPAQRP